MCMKSLIRKLITRTTRSIDADGWTCFLAQTTLCTARVAFRKLRLIHPDSVTSVRHTVTVRFRVRWDGGFQTLTKCARRSRPWPRSTTQITHNYNQATFHCDAQIMLDSSQWLSHDNTNCFTSQTTQHCLLVYPYVDLRTYMYVLMLSGWLDPQAGQGHTWKVRKVRCWR